MTSSVPTPAQITAAAQINASILTAGDYTVMVKGTEDLMSNDDLKDWCSHYGEVCSLLCTQTVAIQCATGKNSLAKWPTHA